MRILHIAMYVLVFGFGWGLLGKANAMDLVELKGRWVLEAIDGKDITSGGEEIYFEITEQSITGYDGCNRFGGKLSSPAAMRKSQRGCSPETPLLPLDLSDPSSQLSIARVENDKLFLPLADGAGEAQFKRSE